MLILTRRQAESIIIGDNVIRITVLGIKGNQVRIGIDAPDDVVILREELYNKENSNSENNGCANRGQRKE